MHLYRKKKEVAASPKPGDAAPKKPAGEKKKALGKKLPAVPESVLKRRKKRDAKRASKLKVALKVRPFALYLYS